MTKLNEHIGYSTCCVCMEEVEVYETRRTGFPYWTCDNCDTQLMIKSRDGDRYIRERIVDVEPGPDPDPTAAPAAADEPEKYPPLLEEQPARATRRRIGRRKRANA